MVCLRLRFGPRPVLLQVDVRGHRVKVADSVQWDADPEHWTQHGPHRWEADQGADFLYSLEIPPCDSRSPPTGGSGNFIYTLATDPQETKLARLLSPVVSSPDSDLCMSFWYHMFGSHIGMLRIKQRKQTVDGKADILLWTVSGHQGNRWREGRVLLPRTSKPYQVCLRVNDLVLSHFSRLIQRVPCFSSR